MSHEIERVMRAFAARPWAIHEKIGERILAAIVHRATHGPRAAPFTDEPPEPAALLERQGRVAVMNLMGTIVPRASAVRDVSSAFASMEKFGAAFRAVASDPKVGAIVLNIDSPGGMVDLVPETAAAIRAARRDDRPIVALANTMAASAAYWLATQADRLYVSPSGVVGSIGIRVMHVDESVALAMEGLKVTHIHAGPRKVEGNPAEPLSEEAKAALQAEVNDVYAMFTADVAAARGVDESVVRADPERADAHMGGGRSYYAATALRLGMVDGVKTFDQVLAEVAGGGRRRSVRAERERLALI